MCWSMGAQLQCDAECCSVMLSVAVWGQLTQCQWGPDTVLATANAGPVVGAAVLLLGCPLLWEAPPAQSWRSQND